MDEENIKLVGDISPKRGRELLNLAKEFNI